MTLTTERVAAALEQRLAQGTYSPGDLVPSAGDLSAEFGVAVGTARRALALLDARGTTIGGGQGRRRRFADKDQGTDLATAFDRIRAHITNGMHPSGTDLPSEADLVAATGFSRYAVREALAELERIGVLVNRPGRRRQVAGDYEAATARYEQIVSAIRDDVWQGRLAPGARTPTELALCERFEMSRVTVRRALAELEKMGVLVRDEAGRRIVA
ncbi:hypothetical protein GCM10009839_39900 [Catenulispora yoronensis]|uniref:HTH gntR-type domain-containing protein n=2 Tax=Catenulispora yoronensis TaxID=450799 RepID=A0ABN2UDH4_9ACTN